MSEQRGPRGRLTGALAVAVAAVLLAGCAAPEVPAPRPGQDDAPVPVLDQARFDRVLDEVAQVVTTADEARDADELTARVDGPVFQLRRARYLLQQGDADATAPAPLGTDRLLEVLPTEQTWPRFAMAVARVDADSVPQLQLLRQESARAPWRLSATATLLPGVTVPQTALPTSGSAPAPPDGTDGLTTSPASAVAAFADVLTQGDASSQRAAFAPDAFSVAVLAEQQAERTAGGEDCEDCVSYAVSHTPRDEGTWAVRTEDGGALVVAVLDNLSTATVETEGAEIPLTGRAAEIGVLAGETEATEQVVIRSAETVVLQLPPAGSDAPITVLAADRGIIGVTAS